MAKTTILLTGLMESNLFNHKDMLALIVCLLIYTKFLAVALTESIWNLITCMFVLRSYLKITV